MDINNKCMKFDLPLDSRYNSAAVIHVEDIGNVQLPVSLKVIQNIWLHFCFFHIMTGIFHRMLKNYCRRLTRLCLAVAYTEFKMTLEILPGKLSVLVYPF